jgi:hypothetical protein
VFFSGADFGVDARLADLSMPAPSARRAEFVLRDTSADGTVFHFVASTGEVDRMGDTINRQGWQLDAFKKNPVILFAHDSGSMPVGKATSVGVSVEGKLLASVRLAQTQFGKAVSAMVSQGFLRAVSVGFAPLEYDFRKVGLSTKWHRFRETRTARNLDCADPRECVLPASIHQRRWQVGQPFEGKKDARACADEDQARAACSCPSEVGADRKPARGEGDAMTDELPIAIATAIMVAAGTPSLRRLDQPPLRIVILRGSGD